MPPLDPWQAKIRVVPARDFYSPEFYDATNSLPIPKTALGAGEHGKLTIAAANAIATRPRTLGEARTAAITLTNGLGQTASEDVAALFGLSKLAGLVTYCADQTQAKSGKSFPFCNWLADATGSRAWLTLQSAALKYPELVVPLSEKPLLSGDEFRLLDRIESQIMRLDHSRRGLLLSVALARTKGSGSGPDLVSCLRALGLLEKAEAGLLKSWAVPLHRARICALIMVMDDPRLKKKERDDYRQLAMTAAKEALRIPEIPYLWAGRLKGFVSTANPKLLAESFWDRRGGVPRPPRSGPT